MKIKMIDSIVTKKGPIDIGEILTARKIPDGTLFGINSPFQVIDGQFSGAVIPLTHCIIHDEERVILEREWLAIEKLHLAKLEKVKGEMERAQALVKELTQRLNVKNNEIIKLNSLNELLLLVLEASARAIVELKKA